MADDGAELRFAVLGPVRAYRAGAEIDLGPAKQRAVLAMLLLGANRPVARDEIIDGVWGERVPRSATNLVATYVARLRRVIDPRRRSGWTVLTSTTAGYRLRLRPEQLDLEVFERLVSAARRDDSVRVAALDDALALWHGRPLDGLPGPFAADERQRLVELRLAVLEQRIDVGLALGEHAEWVAELSRLAALHPYRERMCALQMLALYRLGRQAEALDVFESARRTLADSLGVEPGFELRHLHRRMLNADPTLDLAPRHAASPARAAQPPAQLLADLADFSGRDAEISMLGGWLDAGVRGPTPVVVVVTGPAGVGKTALALHAAHLHQTLFPDGQLHVDLQGSGPRPLRADDVLARFLVDLGVAPARVPALADRRAAMFRTLLNGRRMLILLDDAADPAQAQPLLPGSGGCAVLVTGRSRLPHVAGARCLKLDPLPAGDALTLLARIVGAERIGAEPAAAGAVVAACGGLPLAVRIAGVRLASRPEWTVHALADRLRRQDRRITELRAGGLAVRGSFEASYAALSAGGPPTPPTLAARVFRLLGLLDGAETTAPLAAALAGCPVADAEHALEQLVDVHLVEAREAGRYRFLPLLRLFARELAAEHEPVAARDAALRRAAGHYLTGVRRADRLLRPARMIPADGYGEAPTAPGFASTGEALAWLERERVAIVGVGLQAAATAGVDPMLTATLVTDLRAFMHRRGHWDELGRLASAALAAARRDGHDHAAALALLELGAVAYLRRRLTVAEAHLRHSLALFRRLASGGALGAARAFGGAIGLSRALNNLSLVCAEQGDLDEAAALVEEDLALLRGLGDRFGESVALDNLALVDVRRGLYADAVDHCVHSVELNRDAGAPPSRSRRPARVTPPAPTSCTALNLLGLAHAGLGRPGRAAWCHRRSSQLARRGGNRYWQAQALSDLATAYRTAGRPRRAVASGRQAVLIYRRLGDRHGTATALRRVAEALDTLRRRPERGLAGPALASRRRVGATPASPVATAGWRRWSPTTG
ncbi:MAG TPA: BTAD domain-containing putative transcriptional regulator [Pilimelia sp.]|nr:BTAD domain-containing putative transcriptional regulator [Pilimelia sp.]